MFVPIHRSTPRVASGKNPQLKPAALAAVAGIAAATGLVSSLVKEATHGGRVAGATLIVALAAVTGFLVARGIGRQGKIGWQRSAGYPSSSNSPSSAGSRRVGARSASR